MAQPTDALPPTYEESRGMSPKAPGPAGQPIAMQPMPQGNMNTSGDKVTLLQHLGPNPEWIDCQFCHKRTKTNVIHKGQPMQFVTGALLCLVCICLAPLPCMLHWFEETQWYCTGCSKMVATRPHDSPIIVCATSDQMYTHSQYQNQMPNPDQNQQQYQQQQYPQPSPPPAAHVSVQPTPPPQLQPYDSELSVGVSPPVSAPQASSSSALPHEGPREAGPLPSKAAMKD
ncbi:hypothetical protein S40285_10365 [Stachybotrys chlorohalonatus IBT 40285]|uniref:LITAF domain-containing protein n=1 Tax=Stachybotrys chlorohalonatus (strain IBT 40285) TaxID=1283841 RepID=A0A084R0N8_STAC4|nr:hypothetical protein S40285_10365 [Stachybotrys chlorohalonata IBT 40285]